MIFLPKLWKSWDHRNVSQISSPFLLYNAIFWMSICVSSFSFFTGLIVFGRASIWFWASVFSVLIRITYIDLFKLFISSWCNFGRPYVSRNLSFSFRFFQYIEIQVSWYSITVPWISLVPFLIFSFSLLIWGSSSLVPFLSFSLLPSLWLLFS